MRHVVALAIVVALLAPAAGALSLPSGAPAPASSAGGTPDAQPQITDPKGDATDWNSDAAITASQSGCYAHYYNTSPCNPIYTLQGAAPPVGGVPAPGYEDILSVTMSSSPNSLRIDLELASLDPSFASLGAKDFILYRVGWNPVPGSHGLAEGVALGAWVSDGKLLTRAESYNSYNPEWSGGNESACVNLIDAACGWAAPVEFVAGSPGHIIWDVPRGVLQHGEAGATLQSPTAYVFHYVDVEFTDYGSTVRGAEGPFGGAETFSGWRADVTSRGTDFVLQGTPAPLVSHNGPFPVSSTGRAPAVQSLEVVENATYLGLRFRFSTPPDPAQGISYIMFLIFPDGSRSRTWAANDGNSVTYVGTDYREGNESTFQSIDTLVERDPGPPGAITLSISRAGFPVLKAGELLRLARGFVIHYNDTVEGVEAINTSAYFTVAEGYSTSQAAPPYILKFDSAPVAGIVGTGDRIPDAVGDVVLPPALATLGLAKADQFDITYLEAKGDSPTSTRLTLGIRDLSSIAPPPGYDGVLYAAAVETAKGRFMAGLHKQSDPKVAAKFFCALDADVLTNDKRDPTTVVWQEIQGFFTTAANGAGGGGGGAGSITFIVPHACLSEPMAGEIRAERIAAGTFLIQAGKVEQLDSVQTQVPTTLGLASVEAATPPWWIAPFGFGAFWNIVALAATGSGGLIAVLARHRRRTTLQRELQAVEEAHKAHRANAPAWTLAMNQCRTRGAELLRRNRLRPDELLVIERRIELLGSDMVRTPAPHVPLMAVAGALLLDRYELQRLLGEGAQGRAFLARDTKLQRDVVVKVLSTSGMDARAKRLLLAEARLAAGIDHPNVVRVLDVQETETDALIILEYVEGGTVRGLLARRDRLSQREALGIIRGVLAGLEAAHARGIVHRDVKPENVLLTKDGQPKLADFGAAREVRADATIVPGATGTLAYMSPEQVRGLPADARSDLYAAAAMLYEMLAGETYIPVGRVDEYQLRSMITERAPDLRLPNDSLSLTPVLLRALAKTPAERYPTEAEFMAALDRAKMG